MRINPITPRYFNNINLNLNKGIDRTQSCDFFIKSKPFSFEGKLGNSEKRIIQSFENDLYNALFHDTNFGLHELQKIARKFNKDLSVKSMREAPDGYRDFIALYYYTYGIDEKNLQIKTSDETLFLNDSALRDFSDPINFYVSTVHEFTHSIQAKSPDTSLNAFQTSYLKNSDDKEKAIFNIRMCNKVTYAVQKLVTNPLLNVMQNNDALLKETVMKGIPSICILDDIYSACGANDFDSFVKKTVDMTFEFFKKNGVELDKKHILNYTAKQFENECEAYKNERDAYKKITSQTKASDLCSMTFSIVLYSRASKILKQMAEEY